MKRKSILTAVTLATLALAQPSGLVGCSAPTKYQPSQALVNRTPAVQSDIVAAPRYELTLAVGDGVGMHMRDVQLARAKGFERSELEPILVRQTER